MVLIAISTLIGFATFTLIVTANRRQIRRLKRRLDTQAKTMIFLAELIRDGDEPDDPEVPAIPPARPERHLHIVRDTAAIAALALLLRRTAHAAREHPSLTAVTVAATGVAVTAALLTLPGTPRQPDIALPTATGLSSYTAPFEPATAPPTSALSTPPSATGPRTPPQGTGTPQPSGTPPLPVPPPSAPPSTTGASSTGTPQPSPTAVSTTASSTPPAATPTTPSPTTRPPTSAPTTPPSTPGSRPPAAPCPLALDAETLLEFRLLCGY